MAVKAQEKGVELLCFIEPDVPTHLLGDGSRLRQVLINLIGNAVKFTEAGEVSIRVRLAASGGPRGIRFDIRDSGVGIPDDKHQLLFQPFSQVDAYTARRYCGTGLGLSSVRGLVDLMGGDVGFLKPRRVGVLLLHSEVPPERQPTVEQNRGNVSAGWRILVVDDNAASRGLVMELLTIWKASGQQANNTEAALDMVRNAKDAPFDAVLVDLEMLGGELQRFANLIHRKHRRGAGTAIVLMTPLNLAREEVEGWSRLGIVAHVSKPVKQGDLGKCLASTLGYVAPLQSALHQSQTSREPTGSFGRDCACWLSKITR